MTKILNFPSKIPSQKPRKIILKSFLSPGDIVMLTAAVRDLKKAHGDKILVDVRTSADQIWENNPYLTKLDEKDPDVRVIEAEYPLIHRSNTSPFHFIHGYRMHLEEVLGINIPATDFKGDIHISDVEKSWISQIEELGHKEPFWIVNAGGKGDFTCLTKGTKVLTDRGYLNIEDVKDDNLVFSEKGFVKHSGSVEMGKRKCLRVKTRLTEIECSLNHRLLSYNRLHGLKWKEAKSLAEGDFLLSKRPDFKEDFSSDIDSKWFSVGRLWGDGCLSQKKNSKECHLIFSEDETYAKEITESYFKKSGIQYYEGITRSKNKKIYRLSTSSTVFSELFPKYKKSGKWREDGLPDFYFSLSKRDSAAFIQGLFSADGTLSKRYFYVTFTSIYKNLSKDVRRILYSMGVTASIKKRSFLSNFGTYRTYYLLSLMGEKSKENFKKIGFGGGPKNKILFSYKTRTVDKFHGLPCGDEISELSSNRKSNKKFTKLKADCKKAGHISDSSLKFLVKNARKDTVPPFYLDFIKNNWFLDKVESVEEIGELPVYDIINSESSSYISEGLVSHNCKWWNPKSYQKVVNHFKGKITFVQVGEKGHFHVPLNGVINLIGKTDFRQLIRLVYHSVGVLSPVTALMHLAAAIEMKNTPPKNRAGVILGGGREPVQWEMYPHHQFLHTNGSLPCCDNGGCWKSRCTLIGDGDNKDKENVCIYPVDHKTAYNIGKTVINFREAKCLNMITPKMVIEAVEKYYKGGVLKYNNKGGKK